MEGGGREKGKEGESRVKEVTNNGVSDKESSPSMFGDKRKGSVCCRVEGPASTSAAEIHRKEHSLILVLDFFGHPGKTQWYFLSLSSYLTTTSVSEEQGQTQLCCCCS